MIKEAETNETSFKKIDSNIFEYRDRYRIYVDAETKVSLVYRRDISMKALNEYKNIYPSKILGCALLWIFK